MKTLRIKEKVKREFTYVITTEDLVRLIRNDAMLNNHKERPISNAVGEIKHVEGGMIDFVITDEYETEV